MNSADKRILIAIAAATLLTAGCAKRQVATTEPPPPSEPPAAEAPAPAAQPAPPPPAPAPAPVTAAPEPAPAAYPTGSTRARIDQLLASIEDAYFDYNQATLRPDAVRALQGDATELADIVKNYPGFKLTIEGHCDERGSAEYNIGLGAQRAAAAKEFLVRSGIPAAQLDTISYGNERPVCMERTEACWQRNRRVHFVPNDPPQ
jgi:peptidoglycan-associated lipoprotein